jgi:glycosyltransferase involved in cell wall biosynthesis
MIGRSSEELRDDARPGRVLAVHRYYWPDTPPYASMLRDIATQWSMDGLDVEVMSSQPSYKRSSTLGTRPSREQVNGVTVRRVGLRSEHGRRAQVPINIVLFSLLVVWRILTSRRRFDVVMTSTAPPVVLAWLASMAARSRGGKFVYHCMDIHPEIGRISGEFSNSLVFRVLQRLDHSTCARAAAVVVLSTDMADSLRRRNATDELAIHVINNFELGERRLTPPTAVAPETTAGVIRIVFTGNIGRFQGLDTVVAALSQVHQAKVVLALMGDGSAVADLRNQAAAARVDVEFIPHGDVASARQLIATADLGLVSLTGGIHRFAYPSKTMTYLAEGCPILAVVEPDCELVELLEREGLGMAVPPADPSALATALDHLAIHPTVLSSMRTNARERGSAVFDKEATLKLWSRLMQDTIGEVAA